MAEVKRVIDVVTEDMDAMRRLIKCGLVDICRINDYQIYVFYSTLNKIESKMDRYEFTAAAMGVTSETVRRVISKMEKKVKI